MTLLVCRLYLLIVFDLLRLEQLETDNLVRSLELWTVVALSINADFSLTFLSLSQGALLDQGDPLLIPG